MTHYLTQIKLTRELLVKIAKSQKLDTYTFHKLVYDQFERDLEIIENERSLPLWAYMETRLEKKLLILSAYEPRCTDDFVEKNKTTIVFPENILKQKDYIFKCTVNPVVKMDGKLKAILDRDAIKEWFCKIGEKNGFTPSKDNLVINKVHSDIFSKKEQKVTINKADLSGELTVTDTDLFRRSVLNGIGRSKSFGCGLLQVIPKTSN